MTTTRTFTVSIDTHPGTYPDPGALTAAILRILTARNTGLCVIDVRVGELSLLVTAADLLSEHGENAEYDRAIVELTTRLLGFDDDWRDDVRATLRSLNPATNPERNPS